MKNRKFYCEYRFFRVKKKLEEKYPEKQFRMLQINIANEKGNNLPYNGK